MNRIYEETEKNPTRLNGAACAPLSCDGMHIMNLDGRLTQCTLTQSSIIFHILFPYVPRVSSFAKLPFSAIASCSEEMHQNVSISTEQTHEKKLCRANALIAFVASGI